MDINSISNLITTTTFPIALVIIFVLGGYKLFNKYIAPLIISCIESNNKFVASLENINNKFENLDSRVGIIENNVNEIKVNVNEIRKKGGV